MFSLRMSNCFWIIVLLYILQQCMKLFLANIWCCHKLFCLSVCQAMGESQGFWYELFYKPVWVWEELTSPSCVYQYMNEIICFSIYLYNHWIHFKLKRRCVCVCQCAHAWVWQRSGGGKCAPRFGGQRTTLGIDPFKLVWDSPGDSPVSAFCFA